MPPPPNELTGGLIHPSSQYYRGLSEDYYRRVSPLCRRLLDDMTVVRESWGDEWHHLPYAEQCRLLDQAIVDETTVQKYHRGNTGPNCEYFPKMKLPTGQKIVCDESLSARGYTCSWRDEHSAPFSWHTRSQMDLTLDTPPMTPTNPGSPAEDTRVITGPGSVYKSRPLSLHIDRPPGFTWHYDPITQIPPDPPDLVLGSTHIDQSQTLPASTPQGAHLVIRADEEPSGLMNKLKGAFTKLTTSCFPIHICRGAQPMHTLHHAPALHPPELRPPHVLAQATKPNKKKNSLTGSQHSITGIRSTRNGRSSFDKKLSPSTPTNNVHASLKSLYGYYESKQDGNNDNIPVHVTDGRVLYQNKSNECINRSANDLRHKVNSNGSLHKNLNLYETHRRSRSSISSHDDVTTYPTRTVTTTQSNSLISNTSWASSSQFQESPTLTLRSSPQSMYKQDSNANSQTSICVDNNNATAINVQNNLKAHFRIHERPKVDEVTFRIKKDPHEEKKMSSQRNSQDDAKKPLLGAEKKSPAEQKRSVSEHAVVQRKYSDEEDLPQVDLSTCEFSIPKTGFDFLDNW